MRVLLTNNTLALRAGSELYLRDVAMALMRRGHWPVAYSRSLGEVANELRAACVPVIDSLDNLREAPDIIHGQHHYETLSAMMRFPTTPAIYYCHGWLPWEEAPLRFPRIRRYVAVDELCRERLIVEGGIDPQNIDVLFNFFDGDLFTPRAPLPAVPKLALAFSNTFTEERGLSVLREACARCGIELHATQGAVGQYDANPERLLKKYDIVFAKARAAIEAMAVGAAVVLCNPGRLGPMITSKNYSELRPLNFGIRTMPNPLEPERVEAELRRYDAQDACQVTQRTRRECEKGRAIDRLVKLYEEVITEWKTSAVVGSNDCGPAVARYLEQHSTRFKGREIEEDRNRWAKRCLDSEADRDRWQHRCLDAEADRDRWQQRCLGSEADRDLWQQRCLASETDRNRWEQRCLGSESDRDRWRQKSEEAVSLLRQERGRSVSLAAELDQLQSWPAWRFAKRVFESWPMRCMARPVLRAMRRQWRQAFSG